MLLELNSRTRIISECKIKLLVLDFNTWNYLTVQMKLFIF